MGGGEIYIYKKVRCKIKPEINKHLMGKKCERWGKDGREGR